MNGAGSVNVLRMMKDDDTIPDAFSSELVNELIS